jgi:hypothetical protein
MLELVVCNCIVVEFLFRLQLEIVNVAGNLPVAVWKCASDVIQVSRDIYANA